MPRVNVGLPPAFLVRKRLPPRAALVGDGQSVATGKFRSRSADEQSERGAGDRDKTLSCSCPAQKSKNFVSRARSRSAALRGSFRLGSRKVAGPVSAPPGQRRHASRQHTEEGQAAQTGNKSNGS